MNCELRPAFQTKLRSSERVLTVGDYEVWVGEVQEIRVQRVFGFVKDWGLMYREKYTGHYIWRGLGDYRNTGWLGAFHLVCMHLGGG